MTRDRRDETAAEARDLVRRAVGDAAGLTVKGQIKRAIENLGYGADGWRVREAWYGRAGRWVGTALLELHERFTAWREREAERVASDRLPALAGRVAAVQRLLDSLQREVEALEGEIAVGCRSAHD